MTPAAHAPLHPIAAFDRIGEENAFAVLARAAALAAQGRDIINLGIGQPDFPTPPHIVEAAIKALRDGHHGYTPSVGIEPLRTAVAADVHRRFGTEIDPGKVVIVPGGKVTMFSAILMLGEPGAEILYPDPGFPIYRSMIEFTGATPVPVPIREENGFGFSAQEALALITPRTRLVILNSPANPTGGVTPKAEIDAFVAGLEAHPHVAILSDEIYDQFLFDGEKHTTLLSYPEIRDRLILLNGWSKTYAMTGWRLGWALWPEGLFDAARKLAVNAWSCVNAPAQYGCARRADRTAGLRCRDGGRVRPPPPPRGGRAQRSPGHLLRGAQGRLLRLPQHLRHRLELGEKARYGLAGRGGSRHHRRAGLRDLRRRLYPTVLCELG